MSQISAPANSSSSLVSASPSPYSRIPTVHGIKVSDTTQCAHWHSPLDTIAINHYCCRRFYACVSCHDEGEGHASVPWPRSVWQNEVRTLERQGEGQRDKSEKVEVDEGKEVEVEGVVLCGKCKSLLSVREYLGCESR